jgi:catechol 2,3-dioxygenase-like lactoylglutathione lyase family enzyme
MKFAEVRLPASDVDALAEFYSNRLGFPIIQRSDAEVHFQAGRSKLVFVKDPSPQPLSPEERAFSPQHFAFNIPEHRLDDAKAWLQARCDLILDKAGEVVIHSENWNADSLYFHDPDGNIGELIARHTQPTSHAGAFDSSALQCVSEVGIAADDPAATARLACEQLNVNVYRAELNDTFVPVGDEDGLFIIVKTGRLWYPNRVLPARSAPITVAIENAVPFALTPNAQVTPLDMRKQRGFEIR